MEFDLLSWIQKDAFFTLPMLLGIVMGFSGSLTKKKHNNKNICSDFVC